MFLYLHRKPKKNSTEKVDIPRNEKNIFILTKNPLSKLNEKKKIKQRECVKLSPCTRAALPGNDPLVSDENATQECNGSNYDRIDAVKL